MNAYAERRQDDAASWRSRAAACDRLAETASPAEAADYRRSAERLREHAEWCDRQAAAGHARAEAQAHRDRAANHRAFGHLEQAEAEERMAREADARAAEVAP